MKKELSEMSKEELWQLFPIFLTEHRSCWKEWYEEEGEFLRSILPMEKIARISHVGSTAIPSIWAKPIVDIMVEVKKGYSLRDIRESVERAGYLCMSGEEERISFNKGYTTDGFAERVFHLHLRREGDCDEIYFRDYLLQHEDAAKEYEKLKLDLWKQYEHDRDGYTESKTALIRKYTEVAKEENRRKES